VLAALQASAESIAALQEGVRGVWRLGVIAALSKSVACSAVIRLCERHPELRLEIVEDAQPHLMQGLLSGSLDLMLCRHPLPLPPRLHFEWLRADQAVVVSGMEHPLVGRRGLTLADLGGYAWMRAGRGLWIREVFDALFPDAGRVPHLYPISTTSVGPLPDILSDGQTLALCPASLAGALQRRHQLEVLDLVVPAPPGEVGALCTVDMMDHPLQRELIAALRQC